MGMDTPRPGKPRTPLVRVILGLCVGLAAAPAAPGQEWARKMFDHTAKDLGTVARGAKVEHVFTLENIYMEDAHIASIRSSCSCTVPEVQKPLLKTYEKTQIVAIVDTKGHSGRKDVTLTVVFDQPFPAEVQLNLYVFIRSDVVFQPGAVQFGSVAQGTGAERKLSVVYAGRPNWRITRVESPNPHVEAQAAQVSRDFDPVLKATKVTYELVARLKADAPPGRLLDQVVVVTDDPDPKAAHVPVAVEATVVAPLTVNPSPLLMGPVAAGSSVTKTLVVRAAAPFRVVGVTCADPGFSFDPPTGAKTVQIVPVTFKAGAAPGKVSGTVRIETDLPEGRFVEVKADALVLVPGG